MTIMDNTSELSANHGKEDIGLSQIPNNIARYFNENHCNIQINICSTDVECGYGHRTTRQLKVMRPFCKCQRCNYHSLWNPDDRNSRCIRHTYTKGWDEVFCYSLEMGDKKLSLEDAFEDWLQKQPQQYYLPTVSGYY